MLAYWKKSGDKLSQHIKKQRYYFANKVHIVKAVIFPVVMCGYEIWTIKNGWASKNWCFQTVVLEKTLESHLNCKEIKAVNPKGNQPWLFTERTNAEAEAETPILGHLMRRTDSLEKSLMLGKIEGRRRRDDRGWDGWMAPPTQWTWVWVNSGSLWWTGKPGGLQSMGSQRIRHDRVTELNWIGFS